MRAYLNITLLVGFVVTTILAIAAVALPLELKAMGTSLSWETVVAPGMFFFTVWTISTSLVGAGFLGYQIGNLIERLRKRK